jgi:hypothetical protein
VSVGVGNGDTSVGVGSGLVGVGSGLSWPQAVGVEHCVAKKTITVISAIPINQVLAALSFIWLLS